MRTGPWISAAFTSNFWPNFWASITYLGTTGIWPGVSFTRGYKISTDFWISKNLGFSNALDFRSIFSMDFLFGFSIGLSLSYSIIFSTGFLGNGLLPFSWLFADFSSFFVTFSSFLGTFSNILFPFCKISLISFLRASGLLAAFCFSSIALLLF